VVNMANTTIHYANRILKDDAHHSCIAEPHTHSPCAMQVAVVNVANAMGNLAAETDVRLGFRAAGGVGALVRVCVCALAYVGVRVGVGVCSCVSGGGCGCPCVGVNACVHV